MRIPIKTILKAHNAMTGESVSLNQLAREMTSEGLFCSFESARGIIQYNNSGRARSADYELVKFLMKRFNLKVEDIITDN